MSYETTTYRLVSVACAKGHAPTLKEFTAARGTCRACRGRAFDAVIERTVIFKESDDGPTAADVALKALADVRTPSSGIHDTILELKGVDGRELILALAKPAEEAGAWIHEKRRAAAVASLRPDQRVCGSCGTIFTPPKYGPNADGFCSPRCRGERKPGPASTSERTEVVCPHCGRVLRLRAATAGQSVACPACNRRFTP